MFTLVQLQFVNGVPTCVVMASFSSYAAAAAYRAAKPIPSNFLIVTAWGYQPPGQGQPLPPQTLTAGQFVSVFVGTNVSGVFDVIVYGGFASQAAAQQWGQQQAQPGQYVTATVVAQY